MSSKWKTYKKREGERENGWANICRRAIGTKILYPKQIYYFRIGKPNVFYSNSQFSYKRIIVSTETIDVSYIKNIYVVT